MGHRLNYLVSIAFYGLVVFLLLPVLAIYKDSIFGISLACTLWLILLVPVLSLTVIDRFSKTIARRVLFWHFICCIVLLVGSLIAIAMHRPQLWN